MAILTRLSRIFKADFHAVLDRIEEPEALLKQAIREMEEALLHHEKTGRQLAKELEQLALKQAELEQFLNELTEKLSCCFDSNNEALAYPLVRQQLEAQKQLKMVVKQRESVETRATELDTQLQEQRILYESTRQKAAIFIEEEQNAVCRGGDMTGFDNTAALFSEEEVELELLQQKQLWKQGKKRSKQS